MISPDWAGGLLRTEKGVPYPNHANIVYVLQHDPMWAVNRLWYDEFLDRVLVANSPTREWRDDDDTRVTVEMQNRFGIIGVGQHTVEKAVTMVARQRPKHIVRDYLTALEWDGIERIAHAFTDYWGADDDDYTRAASRNFFLGMVARILKPGCKLDTMPVFEGPEGKKKSSALEILGGDYYSATHAAVGTLDFLQGLRGKWLLEIAELHSFGKADVRAIRNTLSTRNDDYRKSYGRNVQRYPRECAFAGTSNPKDWGNDENGLRRFWPVACGELRLDLLSAARDQLFAESVSAYLAGAHWWDMPAVTVEIQRDRQQQDEWRMPVLEWCALQPAIDELGISVLDVLINALKVPIERCDKGVQMRVGKILVLAGWERRKKRVGKIPQWRWFEGGNIDQPGNGGN